MISFISQNWAVTHSGLTHRRPPASQLCWAATTNSQWCVTISPYSHAHEHGPPRTAGRGWALQGGCAPAGSPLCTQACPTTCARSRAQDERALLLGGARLAFSPQSAGEQSQSVSHSTKPLLTSRLLTWAKATWPRAESALWKYTARHEARVRVEVGS